MPIANYRTNYGGIFIIVSNLGDGKMKCPKCGYVMGEFELECKRCKLMAENIATEKPIEEKTVVDSSQTPPQQTGTTIVQVQQSNNGNTAWWILALIFAGPIGCLLLPILFFGGVMAIAFASYFIPLIIAGGISWWIWAKHPGKREERIRYIWITMIIGFVATLFWMGIVLAAASTTETACLLSPMIVA